MKVLFFLLLMPFSIGYAMADSGKIVTFYISDGNLVTHHKDIEVISTGGLVDFTINGIPISGPSTMTETGIDTGTFMIQVQLPDTVNGKPLQNGDILLMTYHQRMDNSGNPSTQTQSYVISVTPYDISSPTQNVGIGQEFNLQIYDPNFNLDSATPDIIPLNLVTFRDGAIKVTLADPAFSIPTFGLRETGPNTNLFVATIKIPKEIGGIPIDLGSTAEFDFTDPTAGSLSEQVIATITIGQTNYGLTQPSTRSQLQIGMQTANASGTIVNYQNKINDSVDGVSNPYCIPPSGSVFPIGDTAVSCSGHDEIGNSVVRTFTVRIDYVQHLIPSWFKNVGNFWCNREIDDKTFIGAIQHLIAKKIITLSSQSDLTNSQISLSKNSVCQWKNSMISDTEFLKALGLQQ